MEEYLPDIYQKSIYTIDYSKLLSKGIRCLLYDLDNTIVSSADNEPSQKAKDLFISLKQKGFKVIIFTNSPKIRLKNFVKFFGVEGVSNAKKPLTGKLKKVLKTYGYTKDEVAIVGDQLMTDIKAGNKVGITTILINPVSESDFITTKINRFFERRKMRDLQNKNLFFKGRYYD